MEPNIINPTEVEALVGKERDDWFWDQLDRLVQANVNLVAEVDMLKKQVEARNEMIERARADQKRHGDDIIQMGRELNMARAAAASAVEDYIANTER